MVLQSELSSCFDSRGYGNLYFPFSSSPVSSSLEVCFLSFSLATFDEMGLGTSKIAESADTFSVSFLSTDPDLQILVCCLLANCILVLHEA